jgi:hypothetical protein
VKSQSKSCQPEAAHVLVAVVHDGARTAAAHTDGMDVDTPSSSKKTLPSMSGTVRSATRMLVCEITKQIMSA